MKNNLQELEKRADTQGRFFREIQIEFLIHELKDPISIIETGARTLLERQEKYGALSSSQERTMVRILKNSKKARDMLYNLLEIGRSEAGFCINCNFRPGEAVREVLFDCMETMLGIRFPDGEKPLDRQGIEEFFSESGIYLEASPEVARTEMHQDEVKFRQIFGNLIKNALHHRKGRIDIQMERREDSLLIDVTDDGPGVAPEHHETIFKRYTQLDECSTLQRRGHGLGLAGALILARCLGGDIELISTKGKGATFRLSLPITMEKSGL